MTLLRYQPWSLVGRLHRELDAALTQPANVTLLPRAEVREEAARYALRLDLPGVQPQDIEVTTDAGLLTIKATRKSGEDNAWTYERSFTLPEDADIEALTARSVHGVLEVSIGRIAKVQPRRIEVQAA
jgi:HSP20 family protein